MPKFTNSKHKFKVIKKVQITILDAGVVINTPSDLIKKTKKLLNKSEVR